MNVWKPEPDIFFYACQRVDVKPSQAMYVGDNYFADVVGSRRVGLQPVPTTRVVSSLKAECPVIASFEQLPSVSENL